jgi:4-diphosphocytidyl-2C-methyl-D-erythritol kinase
LAELWGIDRSDPALDDIARGIGADVPFFLHASLAFYVGGGDVLATEYPALPATPVVLVKPREASVSTIEAYRRFDEAPVPTDKPGAIASALHAGDAETAYALIHNNLGVISAQMEPQIQMVLDWLRKQDGTVAVDVCGSGACSFAICDTAATAERLADAMEAMRKYSVEPKKLRLVQQRKSKAPKLFLLEGRRGGKRGFLEVMPTLFIEDESGNFSEEMLNIYGSYKEDYIN